MGQYIYGIGGIMIILIIGGIFIITLRMLLKSSFYKWNKMCCDDVYYTEYEHAIKTLAESKRN